MRRANALERCDLCGLLGSPGVIGDRARACTACVELAADVLDAGEEDEPTNPSAAACSFCGVVGARDLVLGHPQADEEPARICGTCIRAALAALTPAGVIEVPVEPEPGGEPLDPASGVTRTPVR